jgi:hypothetical protein
MPSCANEKYEMSNHDEGLNALLLRSNGKLPLLNGHIKTPANTGASTSPALVNKNRRKLRRKHAASKIRRRSKSL